MKKKLVVSLTGICLLVTMTACSQQGKVQDFGNTVSKNSGRFVVKEIEPMKLDPNQISITNSEWLPTSENDIFTSSDLIAEVEILNSKECVAKAEGKEFTNTIYCKVYTAKIKKLFFSNAEYKDNDEFTFFSACHSSYDFEQSAIDISEGRDYLLFLRKAIDDEKFTFSDIGQFSIYDPRYNIIIKEKNKYVYPEIYTSLNSDKDELIEINQFGKKYLKTKEEKEFLKEFEKMLKSYGKNNRKER
jgi:hypothetical protein